MLATRARRVLRAVSDARELRARRPPRLAVTAQQDRPPVVYYLTPDQNVPHGGVRVNYRHVDVLNSLGFPAAVLHSRPGFRCDWFANSTRVVSSREIALGPHDVLVVPEYYATGLHLLPPEPRKIIFNQGAYHTFDRIPFATTGPGAPYTEVENLVAMLTVSTDSANLLRFAFPEMAIHQARAVVDARVFHPPQTPAGRRIAFLPRRRRQEREQLLHVLRSHGVLDGWELVPIHGVSEQRTAELMRSAAIFLSFSEREGFGLPPAEAMACGCYVVGFTGLGGREYFDPEYCSPVGESDLLAYAVAVREAIERYEADPESLAKTGRIASERVLSRYHEAGLRQDLLAVYAPLLGRFASSSRGAL